MTRKPIFYKLTNNSPQFL